MRRRSARRDQTNVRKIVTGEVNEDKEYGNIVRKMAQEKKPIFITDVRSFMSRLAIMTGVVSSLAGATLFLKGEKKTQDTEMTRRQFLSGGQDDKKDCRIIFDKRFLIKGLEPISRRRLRIQNYVESYRDDKSSPQCILPNVTKSHHRGKNGVHIWSEPENIPRERIGFDRWCYAYGYR